MIGKCIYKSDVARVRPSAKEASIQIPLNISTAFFRVSTRTITHAKNG